MQLHPNRDAIRRVAQVAFWAVLLLLLAFTLLPIRVRVPLFNDKAEHLLSFLVLVVLGAFAWGKRRLLLVALALAIVGGAIEIFQAIPAIGRDAEFLDWVADIAGVGAGLLFVTALGTRWPGTPKDHRHQ